MPKRYRPSIRRWFVWVFVLSLVLSRYHFGIATGTRFYGLFASTEVDCLPDVGIYRDGSVRYLGATYYVVQLSLRRPYVRPFALVLKKYSDSENWEFYIQWGY